ncbi:MAG: hypothetical protein GWN01_16500 [Nitrosopumilaceae archaeon]|nr:hypothetical protein [Nitrosopumilaceae archaeon]NIU87382.1 hypothetical protein [Nitrosopumilaceae archaeon]NIX63035.1 hypothetical protein [Nitrosopumilaceae archaeon]
MTDKSPHFKGNKSNKNKIMMELLDLDWFEQIAAVLTYGAEKYEPDNWRAGIPEGEIVGALLRHITAYRKGEKIDPETGLDHRAQAACNIYFWMKLYPIPGFNYDEMWEQIEEIRKKKECRS